MIPGYNGPTYKCYKCGMEFRVQAPQSSVAESSRCGECNRLHWNAGGYGQPVKVGLDPAKMVNGEWF